MPNTEPDIGKSSIRKEIIETAIRLAVLFTLLFWCFRIIEPFVLVIAWAIIIAIALFPVFDKLQALLGGHQKLAAALISLSLVAVLVVPAAMLTDSLLIGAQALSDAGSSGKLSMSPPASVAQWPLIGEPLYKLWQDAANNLPKFLVDFSPQFKAFGGWVLETVAGTGIGLLMLIISFIISGVLLAAAPKGAQAAEAFAIRLAGHRGPQFASISSLTIRNVALGIVGVSILQSVLLGIGFLSIGLPAAGLLALIVLVLCIVQIGPTLVSLPVIIYVFSTSDTLSAVLFTAWTLVMTFGDGILKPIVFSRGAVVPTVVIFLGAIGGMIAYGIIGLFVGAVVLSLGYEIYIAWLEETPVGESGVERSGG